MTRKPGDIVYAEEIDIAETNRVRNIFIDTIELNDVKPTYVIPAMMSIITFIYKKNNISKEEALEIIKSNFEEFYPVV